MSTSCQVLPIRWVLLHFPVVWEIDGETHFPFDEVYQRMGIVWGKITHTVGQEKYKYQFSRFTPYDAFCCIFPNYEKLMRKPYAFSI